ncbi:MAG: glycosyltransferase [Kiritimatiellae bacterium]|nr:glycosyltransferase [Kiritimatiellia bacterium]
MPEINHALRIVVVSSQSCDSGSNLRGRYLAKALAKAGAEVRFVNGVKALPCRLDLLVSLVTYLRIIFIRCDVIIGLKPFPNITFLMMVKKWMGCFTIIDIDDLDSGYRSGAIGHLNHWLQCPFPRFFSLTTYHIDRLRPVIMDTFKVKESRLYQLPQGVNLDLYYPQDITAWKQSFYARHDLNGKNLVVYTAHLNVASDLDAIYEIIRRAHLRLPSLRFLVIGGGPMEKHFRSLAHRVGVDAITLFTGYLPPSEVVKHLLSGDAAIVFYKDIKVNYYRESMKIREMLALGLRVVCNDVGDLQTFSPYTYQVETDYDACAEQLVRVLTQGGDGREKRGMEYIRRMLDWDQIGRSLYERIMES